MPALPDKAARKKVPRWIRLLRLVSLIYLGLVIVLWSLQDWMLFPGARSQGQPHAVVREPEQHSYELVRLTTRGREGRGGEEIAGERIAGEKIGGEKIAALFGKALDADGRPRADASACPTIIFFYGNAMSMADTFGEFNHFRRLGCNVIVPEYVGYGMSSGRPSEQALYDTADAAYDYLLLRSDIDPTRIIAAGWSLGAAVAIDLAHRRPTVGLMSFSAFTSVNEMGRQMFPWLPTSWLIRHKFESIEKVRQINVPIFIAHGRHDTIIPHAMGSQLAEAATQSPRVTSVWVNSDHGDIFEAQEAIWGPIEAWVRGVAEGSGSEMKDVESRAPEASDSPHR